MSTVPTRVRAVAAVAGVALLMVAGCDGGDQTAPPPADQETEAAEGAPADPGEGARAGSGEDQPADEIAGEEGAAPEADASAGTEPDAGTGDDSGSEADATIAGDPCADLTSEDVGAVLGSEVGDREDSENQGLPEGVDSDALVICMYPSSNGRERPGAALYWEMPFEDFPDEMPEEMQQEQIDRRASEAVAPETTEGESIDIDGASEASVRVRTEAGVTQVTVFAAVDGAVLRSTVMAMAGDLDDSDIPTAVELAELAISKA